MNTNSNSPHSWFRVGLTLVSVWSVQKLGEHFGAHLKSTDFYPLSVATGFCVYYIHLIRLRPPQDDRSRLRALWIPEQKKVAVWLTLGCLLISLFYMGSRITRTVPIVTFQDIDELRPIGRGLHKVSGTPRVDPQGYRWALREGVEDSVPHLTPLNEFKGHLLVISDEPLTSALVNQRGWLSEASPLTRIHYTNYRRYMGLSEEALIYLLDLRGVWWLDPYSMAAILISLLSFFITLGSATRDPENQSRLLFIPKELRTHLEDLELENTELENTELENTELENTELENTELENTELENNELENSKTH